MPAPKKDTVYIDVEDDITAITEKVQSAKADVVALVLPKRCTTLQSTVNMKILHKGADAAGKRVVLITAESALLPIAAASGMYVAKSLQSKPAIPDADPDEEPASEVVEPVDDVELDSTKPVGELAGDSDDAPIELAAPAAVTDGAAKAKKTKPDKKLKVPNFESFRAKLFLGIGALVLLIGLWVLAAIVLPKASVTIITQNRDLPVESTIVASADAKDPDLENKVLPMVTQKIDKQETAKAPTTGSKDVGSKATGSVSFVNCSKDDKLSDTERTIPAGTGISSGSLTFVTQEDVDVAPSGFIGNTCRADKPSQSVAVVAQNAGDRYNLSPRTYAVSGFATMSAVDKNGMGGGTSRVVKVVAETDCTNVKNQVSTVKTEEYTKLLSDQLRASGQVPIQDSFAATTPSAACTPAVGSEASEVTATATISYSMQGVDAAGLEELIKTQATKELNDPTQTILDTGIETAQLTITERTSSTEYDVQVKVTSTAGIKQDQAKLAEAIAGQKKGTTYDILRSTPGVKDVTVSYSPFWVRKTPSSIDKITIVFEKDVKTN